MISALHLLPLRFFFFPVVYHILIFSCSTQCLVCRDVMSFYLLVFPQLCSFLQGDACTFSCSLTEINKLGNRLCLLKRLLVVDWHPEPVGPSCLFSATPVDTGHMPRPDGHLFIAPSLETSGSTVCRKNRSWVGPEGGSPTTWPSCGSLSWDSRVHMELVA